MSSIALADATAPVVLALDLGTSSFRAALFDAEGRTVDGTEEQLPHRLRTTADGGAESDADALFDLLVRCIDGTLEKSRDVASNIAAVGTTCFWHSLLGLDAHGRPITPVFSWADARSGADAAALRKRLDPTVIHNRTGCLLHSSYWPAKLRWLARTNLSLFDRVDRWCSFAEYVEARLHGEARVSLSMASGTGLLRLREPEWDDELLRILELTTDRLNRLVDRDQPAPRLAGEFARRWPALGNVPWYPALGDGACANVGSGAIGSGRLALTLGTSGAVRVIESSCPDPVPADLWVYRLDGDHYVIGGALSNGGNILDWLSVFLGRDIDRALLRSASDLPPDSHGLTLLPFLAGERSPGYYAHATGVFAGLTVATRPEHVVRAAMEAIAYRFALIYDAVRLLVDDPHDIVANGGALLHSPASLQIVADTLGHRLVALDPEAEASARGAALLAFEALEPRRSLDRAPQAAGKTSSYDADAERHRVYRKGLERQRRLESILFPAGKSWEH